MTEADRIAMPLADLAPIGPFAEPRAGMQGRYLLRNPRTARAIGALDAALALLPRRRPAPPARIARILLANWGHLGDVVTTFGAIDALRARHPGIAIGMIVSSWARPAIAAAGLDHVHAVDHWRVSRSPGSSREKLARYRAMRATALAEIAAVGYEAAIDFYPYFPPAHALFHRAGIPVRAGFTSGGFGPLLTHSVPWRDTDRPMAEQYRPLLDAIHPGAPFADAELRPARSPHTTAAPPPAVAALGRYIVLHPGAGAAYKDWGAGNWQALATLLAERWPDHGFVVTGAGAGEVAVADAVAAAHPRGVSVAGCVGWDEFCGIVARAALVICPDTAAGHVAAMYGVPVASIFTGTNVTGQWRPHARVGEVLLRPVRCAPCHRAGCAAMACIGGITPADVAAAAARLLPPGGNGTTP